MRKLTLLLALVTVFSFARQANAQGVTVSGTALANAGYYARIVPSAVITVCPANSAGTPCTPTSVSLFSNFALTTPVTNPFNADANGNYSFYLAPGNYTVTITGVGVAGYSYQISLIGPSVGTPNTWTQAQTFNATIFTQNITPTSPGTYNFGTLASPYVSLYLGTGASVNSNLTSLATSIRNQSLPDVGGILGMAGTTACAYQGPVAPITGTGAAATYYTCTIGQNSLGVGGGVRFTVWMKHTTGTASVSYTMSFGGTSTTAVGPAGSASQLEKLVYEVHNASGATATQTMVTVGQDSNAGTNSIKLDTAAVATTSNVTVLFQFNVANTDAITPEMLITEMLAP